MYCNTVRYRSYFRFVPSLYYVLHGPGTRTQCGQKTKLLINYFRQNSTTRKIGKGQLRVQTVVRAHTGHCTFNHTDTHKGYVYLCGGIYGMCAPRVLRCRFGLFIQNNNYYVVLRVIAGDQENPTEAGAPSII